MYKRQVYTFGNGQAEGKADMKNLLGGKGANLAEMNLIGIPVPPGLDVYKRQPVPRRPKCSTSGSSWNCIPTPCPQRSRTTLKPFLDRKSVV